MGLRFRKSFKLAPGIRMNFSGSGASWTLGPSGASAGIGKRGTYPDAGIPEAGVSAKDRLAATDRKRTTAYANMPITIGVDDDGVVYFRDEHGNSLAENLVSQAKKQQADAIRNILQKKCNEINTQIESLGEIHVDTPGCNSAPQYHPKEFPAPAPQKPAPKKSGLIGMLFKSWREQVERENVEQERQFGEDCKAWQAAKRRFEEADTRRKNRIETGIYSDVDAMEKFLEEDLQGIIWPRETIVATEIVDDGKKVFVDVDLPQMEEMPGQSAAMPQRGYRLSVTEMSAAQIQRLYMRHVHGVGFRIIGEIFSALPNAGEVVLSACSRRSDQSTGHVADEYLYSVRVERDLWSRLAFDNLKSLDIVEALAQFDLRRNMTEAGVFEPVEPFGLNMREN